MMTERAIWLYGSHARGDALPDSDIDVLMIGEGHPREAWSSEVGGIRGDPSISRYSWSEIGRMAEYGSLFLHHLRLEGRPIYEDEGCRGVFRRLLDGLPGYTNGLRDVQGFGTVLRDIKGSVRTEWDDPFELSVLGTIVRHSAILGCWLQGVPEFGRTRPVRTFADGIGCGEGWEGFRALYQYRLYCDGRVGKETLDPVDGEGWWGRARELVDHLEVIIGGDYSEMSS